MFCAEFDGWNLQGCHQLRCAAKVHEVVRNMVRSVVAFGEFASGTISLGVNAEEHFLRLANALGRTDWMADTRFAERKSRKTNAAALADEIEAQLAKKSTKDWEPILQASGVPAARLRSLPEALASDQIRQRGFVQQLSDGSKVPTLPFRFNSADPIAPSLQPPKLGEHGDEIRSWLNETKA